MDLVEDVVKIVVFETELQVFEIFESENFKLSD